MELLKVLWYGFVTYMYVTTFTIVLGIADNYLKPKIIKSELK